MAKQTFSVGQTLTAAQMTSLQQTAMLGGAASAKTASYTLVAADAGSAISMSNASATTITVNTALFAAGDTVHITNLGAGVCTITAGTATVNSSASLALAQYESGFLDFTSTSAAIFVKGAGAAATSGGMTLLSTTSLTGSSVTVSSIDQTYIDLYLVVENAFTSNNEEDINFRFNADATANRHAAVATMSTSNSTSFAATSVGWFYGVSNNSSYKKMGVMTIPNYANTTNLKFAMVNSSGFNAYNTANTTANFFQAVYNQATAISSFSLFPNTGNFSGGTVKVYGVK
jgi:hypothetical protein